MSDSSCEWSSAGELSSVCSWSTTHGQSSVLDITVNEAGLLSVQDLSVTNSEGTNWTPSPMKGVPVASTPVSPVQDISANWTPSPLKGVLLMSTPVRKKRHTASKPGSIRRSPSIPKGNSMMFERSPNSQFMSEKWELFKVMSINGCQEHCTTTAHDLGEYDILLAHSSFISVSSTEQRRWIYHYFNTHCPNDKEGVKHPGGIQFFLCGKPVCQGLWLAALGISTSRFYDSRRQFLEETGPPAQKKHRSLSAKSLSAISWMRSYFEKVGDKRPDKDGIFLPTCLTEGAIYSRMVEEIGVGDEYDSICFSQFNRIYRQHFPNVTIPKECRFTKCNFCTLIKNETFKPSISLSEKKKLKELLDDHLKLQEQERARYYSNRQKAIDDPVDCLSMICDGMDQNKTNLPSFVRSTKACQNLWRLRTHLTGCLVHGLGCYSFFDFLQISHDCNLTLTCVLLTIVEVLKQRKLPRRLLLQMDNCVRENKNKYVFGFLAYLVEKKVFSEIELGFLMVGHTHEDIDQSFSCLSRYLRKNDALSMPELALALKASNQNVKTVSSLKYVFDIRNWIAPHLSEIHGHTAPHVFRFRFNHGTKKAEMHYKHWSHDPWEPHTGHGLHLLKSTPLGLPDCVQPSLDKVDLVRLTHDIPKYDSAGLFHEEVMTWWQPFLSFFESTYGSIPSVTPPWPLDIFRSAAADVVESNPVCVPEKISSMHSNQMENRPQIQIGNARKGAKKGVKKGNRVPENTDATTLESIHPGDFVAMKINKYCDDLPQLGDVKVINSTTVTVDWLVGSYTSVFGYWKERGKVIQETFPYRGIMRKINLTPSMRIRKQDITALRKEYDSAEFV